MHARPTYPSMAGDFLGHLHSQRFFSHDTQGLYSQQYRPVPSFTNDPFTTSTLISPPPPQMPGFKSYSSPLSNQFLLSPVAPTRSTFSPPPHRPPTPVLAVPPSLISEFSPPISPYSSVDAEQEAFSPAQLSLTGNSIAKVGCDSPIHDSLDYEHPLDISARPRMDMITQSSIMLQNALGLISAPTTYPIHEEIVDRIVPAARATFQHTITYTQQVLSNHPLQQLPQWGDYNAEASVHMLPTVPEECVVTAEVATNPQLVPAPEGHAGRRLKSPLPINVELNKHCETPLSNDNPSSSPFAKDEEQFAVGRVSLGAARGGEGLFGGFTPVCDLVNSKREKIDLLPSLCPPKFDIDPELHEFVCYRRNYISLSVSIALPCANDSQIWVDGNEGIAQPVSPVASLRVTIECLSYPTTSKPIQLLQFEPSRKLRLARPVLPHDITLTEMEPKPRTPGRHPQVASTSFVRLQFRSATANNGKPSHTQEHFVMVVRMDAVTEDGSVIEYGRWTSRRFIVRGRSPKNFVPGRGRKGGNGAVQSSGPSPSTHRGSLKRSWEEEDDNNSNALREVHSRVKRVRKSALEACARFKRGAYSDEESGGDDEYDESDE
ncbi:hypothetical protein T439DRAFT_330053 [Meredithblackwellia eburnea MCA 4105]